MDRWLVFVAVSMLYGVLGTDVRAQEEPGCFDVTVGAWSPIEGTHTVTEQEPPGPPDTEVDSVSYMTPSRIRLARRPAVRPRDGLYRIVIPETTLPTPHRFQSWSLRSDTLELGFSTGLSGTQGKLTRDGSGWSGSTETWTDVAGAQRYRRAVRLDPVDCAAPPTVPASLDPPLLRRIELMSGQALELGAQVPAGVRLEPRRTGAWTAVVEATGIWAGHDTVVVRLDRERVVHHIELRYPRGFDLSLVADSLRRGYPPDRYSGTDSRWWNRTTRMWFDVTGRPRVVMLDPRYF